MGRNTRRTPKPHKTSPFGKQHLLALSFAGALLGTALMFLPNDDVEANRAVMPLDLELNALDSNRPNPDIEESINNRIRSEIAEPRESQETAEQPWHKEIVRSGDNPSIIFSRVGLDAADLQELTYSSKEAAQLKSLYPGEKLYFQFTEDDKLAKLRHIQGPLKSTLYTRNKHGFTAKEILIEPEVKQVYRQATLQNSLFVTAQEIGISAITIMDLANIFGGVIDFVLDPRAGDTFSILYEEKYLNGKKIGEGAILAAQYINQGETFNAFRYVEQSGDAGYYNEKGESMRKAFLRAPLDFTRVSSEFNLRRMHPIHKMIKAHRGIDYSAPTGTPVFSAGEGRVIASGFSQPNGNYVFIQHGDKYITKYLHLHKRSVNTGQRVKQGQTIGTVGATGYATGPHLHYEFIVDGVHRNPRTIVDQLPKAVSIAKQEMPAFLAQKDKLDQQFALYRQAYLVATNETAAESSPTDSKLN